MNGSRMGFRALVTALAAAVLVLLGSFLWRAGPMHEGMSRAAPETGASAAPRGSARSAP